MILNSNIRESEEWGGEELRGVWGEECDGCGVI